MNHVYVVTFGVFPENVMLGGVYSTRQKAEAACELENLIEDYGAKIRKVKVDKLFSWEDDTL